MESGRAEQRREEAERSITVGADSVTSRLTRGSDSWIWRPREARICA